MLIFKFTHSLSISFVSNAIPLFTPRNYRSSLSLPSISAIHRCQSTATGKSSGVAVLWFKHDLRIDDHPGLHAASQFPVLLPLYIFDPRILSRFPDEMLEIIIVSLEDLRQSLRDRGLDLLIKFGNAKVVIRDLVHEVKATDIFAEEEAEHDLCELINDVSLTLERLAVPMGSSPNLRLWRTPFYDIKSLEALPESYDDFRKLQFPITPPLSYPTFTCLKLELNWGNMPTFDDLKEFVNSSQMYKPTEAWDETALRYKYVSRESSENNSNLERTKTDRMGKSIFFLRKGNNFGRGGTEAVLNALSAYLRYNEGTARADWQAIHEMVRNAESRDGASFIKLFGHAIHLGIISRRRVHYEAIKYEKERNAGFLSPFGYSAGTVAAAVDAALSTEWYWLMALRSKGKHRGGQFIRIWRWNGFLVQYTVVGCEGPAILLVHGFGAFLDHFRDNIRDLAEGGNQVWAITILGFGRSEKPNIVYSEQIWAELLRDFVIEVVGRPVHLVGNSIGGYIVAIVAGHWPSLVKSVVLINSAGRIIPGYSYLPFNKERKVSSAAWLGARLLLFYLGLKTKDIVRNCYPTRTERADDWLISEMLRASKDPGVLVVLESIFSFNLSVPLNYLLKGLEERVLIIQGMKDPIYNSKAMVAMLKEQCAGVIIKELQAGHCPHDEIPEEVNFILCEWIVTINRLAN